VLTLSPAPLNGNAGENGTPNVQSSRHSVAGGEKREGDNSKMMSLLHQYRQAQVSALGFRLSGLGLMVSLLLVYRQAQGWLCVQGFSN
jgi:hypothetical protein